MLEEPKTHVGQSSDHRSARVVLDWHAPVLLHALKKLANFSFLSRLLSLRTASGLVDNVEGY